MTRCGFHGCWNRASWRLDYNWPTFESAHACHAHRAFVRAIGWEPARERELPPAEAVTA